MDNIILKTHNKQINIKIIFVKLYYESLIDFRLQQGEISMVKSSIDCHTKTSSFHNS